MGNLQGVFWREDKPRSPPPCQLPPTCACALHLTVVRTNCSWPGVCLDGLITFH